jgi:hypothetical protein
MAKFKSIQTGEVYEFTQENDIKTMRVHTEYVEVKEEEEKPAEKKVGRPLKAKE